MNESKRTKLTNEQHSFLRDLMRWQGVASSQDLAPQMSQADNSARQTCKRRGWVTFDGPGGYWRITDLGRSVWKEHSHTDADALSR